jgi:zinc protease
VKILIAAFFYVLAFSGFAQAFEVQIVTSEKGIKAWLVESHDVPIVSIYFSFSGGRDLETIGKEGSHNILAAALTEGAGSLTSDEIKAAQTRMSSSYGFYTSSDNTSGYLQSLTKNVNETAALLKASLDSPRFEPVSFERLRDEALQSISRAKTDQTSIADDAWFAQAFPRHIYGQNSSGTLESVSALKPDDLRTLWQRIANRRGLEVAVVGDNTSTDLSKLLDHVFGGLPDTPVQSAGKSVAMAKGPIELHIDYDNPQSVVYFGMPAIGGEDRAAWSSDLLAEILGGRANFARLNQTLREKSGLTYGVSLSSNDWEYADVQLGSFSTATETTEQALKLLREVLADMALNGPTADELRKVKSFINGSFPLAFSDNNSIASALLTVKRRGLSPAYFKDRPNRVNAVTLEDVKMAAATLLKPENQIIVVVGRKK